ncbi:Zn(II)2Cys6 transcription factor [Penicillium waksmanii]|uniref:Zn(II)2Cys6 transcription factor n=1 Tax=Penicillium waksmanii TaxID=69791 RepID=UPI002546FED3|nr:Zn(II)2Cys6 transcription factor [Penicillium waksmanii]KAJ5979625.1 Zn(II)2Cys6 transcription factor [Penicillium waksmanii]
MAPRNRSLTGCGTCRSRHLKCDETRPGCQLCQVLGMPCPGYPSQLKWTRDAQAQLASPPEAQSETRVYRRPLFPSKIHDGLATYFPLTDFTAHEQELMAQATVHSLQGQNANEALENLDIQSGHHNLLPSKCLFQGPFGILNLMSNEALPNDRAELYAYLAGTQKRQEAPISPTPDLPVVNRHFSNTIPESPSITGAEEDPCAWSRKEDEIHDKGPVSHTLDSCESDTLSSIFSNSPLSPTTSQFIPERATQLLRYFENHVVTLSPSIEDNRLCPWRNIHVPSAKKTFAELLIHETANSLGLSLFYSVLAASCIHLSRRDQESRDWDRLGKHYKQICMHHLNLSIQQEVATDGQLPYKELLMSLLSMVILEVSARFNPYNCDIHG